MLVEMVFVYNWMIHTDIISNGEITIDLNHVLVITVKHFLTEKVVIHKL